MVPKSRAEAPVGGGKTIQAEGDWKGVLQAVRVRPFPDFIGRDISDDKNRGYASPDGEILSIEIGDNAPLGEGMEDFGARKRFVDFVIRDGDVGIDAAPDIPAASWQLQRSAALLANFALALGATDEVTDEAGDVFVATAEDFLDQLRDEELNGATVGYTISHRKWTSKDGAKSGTEDSVTAFFTAV